jgi:uncharacterized protein (TIGR03382 family)
VSRFQLAALTGLAAILSTSSLAAAEEVTGQVTRSTSRWARGGSAIITESVLRLDDGREVILRQLGGSADGVGMVVLHGPSLLATGDRVRAEVEVTRDLRGRESRVVRSLWQADAGGRFPFVRTVATRTREPLAWESGCAIVSFHQDGSSQIAGDGEFAEMEASLGRWAGATAGCSYLELRLTENKGGEVGLDGVNLVMFREDRWCRPATDEDPEECYDPSAAGLTTLFFIDDADSDRNGAILDADIELNGVHFAVARDGETTDPELCISDLGNTFTHEVGHLMGLDHTCFAGGERLVDQNGDPQPNCEPVNALDEAMREATMFNFQDCGETKKATPEADDIDAVCAIYPISDDPGACNVPDLEESGCGCAAPGSATSTLPLLSFALLALLLLRRPTGRACSRSRRR